MLLNYIILSILLKSGWILYACLLLCFAVDRLFYFIKTSRHMRASLVTGLILVSWVVFLSFIVVCLPDFGYTFDTSVGRIGWFLYNTQGANVMAKIESYINLMFSGITLALYLVLFFCSLS
ncbi:hypothetical protein L596_021804 [Steinernema carpocapsae]|uniref:Uncharacterized protein n=1 Tax=Steinernema carpocapsae TaxID=34508 RepID=A0A4U5MJV6_STECR|nr:hypothetical protein L596_021804 [Steinernema carpocapsae]